MSDVTRCAWPGSAPDYVAYHDEEWGVPEPDGRALFEKLTLDGFQAGLSWLTILRKRDAFRRAFDGFDPAKIARYGERDVTRLLGDASIVRHRGKIEATIRNARSVLDIVDAEGSFSRWLWELAGGEMRVNHFRTQGEVPAQTPVSAAISQELKRRGFRFVGPTIVYAFMQAVGMVNDHVTSCFRHAECAALGAALELPDR